MNLGITDIIALSKAGYKKKDIDQLLKAPEVEAEEVTAPVEEVIEAPTEIPEVEKAPEVSEVKEEEPDYKSLYESLKAEGLKQAQTIKDLQAKINNQDRTETKVNPMDDLMKSFRNFS